ncbi:protein PHTF1 [Patella vulgata]|uniref:protein PHTF1 n=1 Tax=Patella vulgata TaxID=6465 RepID=UPI0021807B08|nr:protein PHTF1 [Patella vulgata]
MDRVHDSIAWYQKQIGSYDKQLWEQSVERKLQRAPANVHHAPRKSVRVKTEFIDVDLIRGSTFSKTKPQAPWTYITRKAIIRVFLLPFCYRWWIQQTSAYFFAMLFLLYCSQVFTLFIYYGNSGEAIVQDELTVSEVFFPIIITFILGLIHSQTVLSHYSHKPPVRDIKLRNISKAKRRAKESGIPPTVNELVTNSSSVVRETIDNSALTKESSSLTLSSNLSQNGTNTQSIVVNSPELSLRGDNPQAGCDRDLSQGNEGKSSIRRKSIDSAITKHSTTASRSDLENVDTAVTIESCPNRKSNVSFDEKPKSKLSKNLNEINQLQNNYEASSNNFDLTSLVSKPCLGCLQCCGEKCHKVLHHVGTHAYESLCENHESLSDIEQVSDEVNLVETDSEDDCPNITHYEESNQMSGFESRINEECCPSNSKYDDLSRKHNFLISGGQSTQVRKRFTSLQTEDLGEVSDCECIDEEVVAQVEANWRRKRRLSTARSTDLSEIARSRVVPSKLTFFSEHSLSRRGVNSLENDPSQSTPEDGNRVAISTEEWEDRIQSDLTTSSSYSTSCDSANELSDGESINQQEIVDLHQGWTSSSLNVINLLQPPTASNIGVSHAPPDKVSCVIWEGNECKKVDLTALDIGWAIIDKVDNLPESSDYIWIGICFSFLIGCVPLAFRAYHTKELPSVLSYSFLIKLLETAYPSSWRRNVLMVNGIVQRLCLSLIFFFLLSVADRTFKQGSWSYLPVLIDCH